MKLITKYLDTEWDILHRCTMGDVTAYHGFERGIPILVPVMSDSDTGAVPVCMADCEPRKRRCFAWADE